MHHDYEVSDLMWKRSVGTEKNKQDRVKSIGIFKSLNDTKGIKARF